MDNQPFQESQSIKKVARSPSPELTQEIITSLEDQLEIEQRKYAESVTKSSMSKKDSTPSK